jgi:RNA polymerase sigma-70 factor (ECF subfamily)
VEPVHIDESSLQECRAYLKLLASRHVDSWLRQRVDASDLVQQTLLDAVARKEQFQGHSRPELLAWLRRILANNLVDLLRHHGRAKRDMARSISIDEEIHQSFRRVDALVAGSLSPSQKVMHNEQLLRLPEALDQLPEAQRWAIELHYLQGLKLSETAERIGRSEAAVGGLLHRGLKRLNELLGD